MDAWATTWERSNPPLPPACSQRATPSRTNARALFLLSSLQLARRDLAESVCIAALASLLCLVSARRHAHPARTVSDHHQPVHGDDHQPVHDHSTTMASINALLNTEGAEPHTTTYDAAEPHTTYDAAEPHTTTYDAAKPHTTTYEAADALTALATLGGGQQYRDLPSPTATSTKPPPHHAPVEPSPPMDLPQARSPTLDHYHHASASRSPEEQKRRQSLRTEPAPVLAPIQRLSAAHTADTTAHTADTTAHTADTTAHTADTTAHTADTTTHHPADTTHHLHVESTIKDEPVKDEPEPTPAIDTDTRQAIDTGTRTDTPKAIDPDTRKAIDAAKASDLGLRAKPSPSLAETLTSATDAKPASAPSKKRPAPSSASAVKKKGTAKTTKPSNKKRKIDDDDDTPRSVTPTSRPATTKSARKGSHPGTPALPSSPAPDDAPHPHHDDDGGDSSEDHNLYCICKKPDNHKWMIGCDGGCDDWFHGDCVNMKQADEGLVDKFICPLCEDAGRGNTTWKPMCRRDGCRRPARLTKGQGSKYCSDDCGLLFMQDQLHRTAGAKPANGTKDKPKKKKKPLRPDDEGRDDQEEPTPLGGVLRAKDLKALIDASPNIQAFKNLGSGVLSPPHTASPTRTTFTANPDHVALTAAETERLTALHNEKTQLNNQLELLKDREKFVSMAKEQAARVADREKLKLKDFCGYDARLSWSDAEFLLWRNSIHGRAAFQFSTLSPTPDQIRSAADAPADTDTDAKESVCLKKRCAKHPQWQKLNLQDARFEELEVVEAIRECEKEERSVRERARRRNAKDTMAKELTAGDGREEVRNRDGWVEVVAT
ncbi:COMPASS (complex proteins associated with Set1p) component [Ascochyta lentis]